MKYSIILIAFSLIIACNAQENKKMKNNHKFTNHLIQESSPYLLQHAHNPVNWYPWGNEALEKAQKEHKMLLISIGYAACHWCHVMEHESFESEEVAKVMNDNFVCIKVDREERPDIDQIYMNALQIMTGGGGWPLNCFALPDGTPFYGGTYFPKKQWMNVLNSLAQTWKKDSDKMIKAAEQLKNKIVNSEIINNKTPVSEFKLTDLRNGIYNWKKDFDKKYGSNKKAPKFPMPTDLNFLLDYYFYTKDADIFAHLNLTLQKMAYGGIYDQIGGGFARYSTDAQWRVPHFEKMLYDNAQLIDLYSTAYKLTKNSLYKNIVDESIKFVKKELYDGNGTFYSSLDADSEGEEGKFYVWTYDELQKIVPEQLKVLEEIYEINKNGNWEGKIIFYQRESFSEAAKKLNISVKNIEKQVNKAKKILFTERSKRIRPRLDDKSITAWNALMISGLCSAYSAFGEKQYLKLAEKTAAHFKKNLINSDFFIYRNFKNGKTKITGFLDDYALSIKAFTALYQLTGNEAYYQTAIGLTNYVLNHFYDNKSRMFFYTADNAQVPVARKMELTDGVIPASNSVMAQNLFALSKLNYNTAWEQTAKQMLANTVSNIYRYPAFFANWADLELKYIFPSYEMAITGKNAEEKAHLFAQHFYPNVVYAFAGQKSAVPLFENRFVKAENLIYVCRDKVCKIPVSKLTEALKIISKINENQ